jgi:3'(2'), 5'-bisphosphate nucleotidase
LIDVSSVTTLWAELEQRLLPTFADYRSRLAELPIEVKADRTLLTEADIAVQALIIDAVRTLEPDAVVIAEEDDRTDLREDVLTSRGHIWVVDPIDGTAEFVQPGQVEFCSVVCLLEEWQPAAAFVLAPELGRGGSSDPDHGRRQDTGTVPGRATRSGSRRAQQMDLGDP